MLENHDKIDKIMIKSLVRVKKLHLRKICGKKEKI